MNSLEKYLSNFKSADWITAVDDISNQVHMVDRDAVQIWFRFYPIDLKKYLDAAEDRDATIQGLAMLGNFELSTQIDSSHHFLYAHRFWKSVKEVIGQIEIDGNESLEDLIVFVAEQVATRENVGKDLTLAISAVGLATLAHVGADAFKSSTGETPKPSGLMAKSPNEIVAARGKDDSQGLFGFLKSIDAKYSLHFASLYSSGKFPIVNDQQVTHASAQARSAEWQEMDKRCWEGPIPVECTSGSCGTCWIGVVGGADKLTPVQRRERRAMKVFGYNQPETEKPFLRLACQTTAHGNVSIVIPPWNGVFGKKVVGNVEDIELEPNTSSAKALRETIAAATGEK